MRSSPANASLICVPMEAICTSGAATRPMKKTYITKSPRVMRSASIARPPTRIISTPMPPTMTVVAAPSDETPVMVLAMLRNSRFTPRVKTSCSLRSATYDLTTRMPPSDSARRPVTSALICPRSRKMGRSFEKAYAMSPPNTARMTIVLVVRRQLR